MSYKVLLTMLILTMAITTLLIVLWACTYIGSLSTTDLLINKNRNNIILDTTTTKIFEKGTPMSHVPLNQIYNNIQDDNDTADMISDFKEVTLIETQGCKIPIVMVNYTKYFNNANKFNKCKNSCDQRALFLYRESGNRIRVYVDRVIMKKYLSFNASFYCCYRSINAYNALKYKNFTFSVCRKIEHGRIYPLLSDFVNVKCFEYDHSNATYLVYSDFYVFTKAIEPDKAKEKLCGSKKYNVLMIEMNSMSLSRIAQSMPRTVKFFKENFWLCFRGYHASGDITLPKLIAVLTGQNASMWNKCDGNTAKCRELFIWNKFKEDGYVSAFGEDTTSIRKPLNYKYVSFESQPTDHYMNPVFLKRTIKFKNNNALCSGKVTYGQQLLNYALDFVNTYKRRQFFGLFTMNSYSSNINCCPPETDRVFEDFFNKLSYTGALLNTFVIFLSEHGIRYGDRRLEIESYYDERMPSLFMWIPTLFKGSHYHEFKHLVANQFRLVTAYDVYKTLMEIKSISSCRNNFKTVNSDVISQSLFQAVSENRTCDHVKIHEKWCSCHHLYSMPVQNSNEGVKIVGVIVSFINSLLKYAKTEKCQVCSRLSLKKIIRIHFYYKKDKIGIYYVIAFTLNPGDISYEATAVAKNKDDVEILGPISLISQYKHIGRCALEPRDRLFCVCQKVHDCSTY